jgi:hypothetical protein
MRMPRFSTTSTRRERRRHRRVARIMEVALREYNELYREFYSAFGLTAL